MMDGLWRKGKRVEICKSVAGKGLDEYLLYS